MKFITSIFLIFLINSLLTGCYQVQSEDDLRAIPTTNNPNIIPEGSQGGPVPKASF